MSLDLYIISEEPVQHRGTGVYIREGGRNLELKTIEEVRKHFPDSNISHIREYVYEDDKLWHGNITHNLTHREKLEQYNPPIHPETGTRWSDYDIFLAFCQSLATCLIGLDYNDKRYTIEASR